MRNHNLAQRRESIRASFRRGNVLGSHIISICFSAEPGTRPGPHPENGRIKTLKENKIQNTKYNNSPVNLWFLCFLTASQMAMLVRR